MCKWQTKVNFWALAVIDYQSLSHFFNMNKENNSRHFNTKTRAIQQNPAMK